MWLAVSYAICRWTLLIIYGCLLLSAQFIEAQYALHICLESILEYLLLITVTAARNDSL